MTLFKKPHALTEGGIVGKMLLYAIPVVLSGLLQKFYNTADQIVVGQFSGDANALAAIGSTGAFNTLILRLVLGISVGTSVVVGQYWGAKRYEDVGRAVHTSMTFALIGGVFVGILGIFLSSPVLTAMNTRPDVLGAATMYSMIIFCGLPATAVYNFGASVLRATGNSSTPFLILALTGLINVALNLVFVILFGMGVAGVALATVVSQYASAALVVAVLMRTQEPYRLSLRRLGIDGTVFKRILLIGIPSGLQSIFFNFSNMMVQSSVNTFSTPEVSGKTVASEIEGYVELITDGFYQTALVFVSQNYGARKKSRVKKSILYSFLLSALFVGGFSFLVLGISRPIASLFVDGAHPDASAIIAAAALRMSIMLPFEFVSAAMSVSTGCLRGLGCSLPPMLSTLVSAGALRILWVIFVFPLYPTFLGLYAVYPISWAACFTFNLIYLLAYLPRALRRKSFS